MQDLDVESLNNALNNNYIIVLTTNSNERKAVSQILHHSAKSIVNVANDGARLGLCETQLILHLTGTSGGQADKAVGRITRGILSNPRMPKPTAVILVGIGWGVPTKCGLNDVILSGKLVAVNQIRFEGANLSHVAIPRESPWVSELADVSAEIGHMLGYVDEKSNPLKVGVLASGEQFLAEDTVRDSLVAALPDIMGGEMEGWDFVADLGDIPWIQLRGVCDFANTTLSRIHQMNAAEQAARFLPSVIVALEKRERLSPIIRNSATVGLLEVLAGDALHISSPEDKHVNLNHHLNYQFGPSLIWRIAQYALGTPSNVGLAHLLTTLFLEMAQNALRHGGATVVTIGFGNKSVSYSDNGNVFDLYALATNQNGRGGCEALKNVLKYLVKTNFIEITNENNRGSRINKYKILFPMLSKKIREAREQCPLKINSSIYGQSDIDKKISFNPDCDTLFFDATNFMMMSMNIDIVENIQYIINSGYNIIISCQHEVQKNFFENSLLVPENREVSVIVAPMPTLAV